MQRIKSHPEYYLQVVGEDDKPHWPKTDEELTVGSQSIEGGFTQYWAYPASLEKDPEELPEAEELAQKNPTSTPAILVDERPTSQARIVLILTKDGHAWAKTESDLANLEENINSIVDFAKQKFQYKVEHFMTTSRVSKEVEKKLDSVEDESPSHPEFVEERTAVSDSSQLQTEESENSPSYGRIDRDKEQLPTSGVYMQNSDSSSSKLTLILIIIVIVALIGGAVYFRQKIFNKLGLSGVNIMQSQDTPTPEPTAAPTDTPTPTPVSLDRSTFKVKVLNGTSQSGLAATVSDSLKAKGWNMVGVGNAPTPDVAQTEVKVKPDSTDAGNVMVTDLSSDYQATVSADLSKDSTFDIEVIIGAK